MQLAVHDHRVDDVSAVVDRDVLGDLRVTRLGVHLDGADVGAKWPHEVGRLEISHRLQPLLEPGR